MDEIKKEGEVEGTEAEETKPEGEATPEVAENGGEGEGEAKPEGEGEAAAE